jgi:hypothetical protein
MTEEVYAPNNRTSIVKQRISKQVFSTIERLCFLRRPYRGVIKGKRRSFEWLFVENLVEFWRWQSKVIEKKLKERIRLCKEGFLCDLKCFGFLYRRRQFYIQVAPQLSSRGWVDPVPAPLLLRKSGSSGNWTLDLWICSQELWSLDHRGDPLPSASTRLMIIRSYHQK